MGLLANANWFNGGPNLNLFNSYSSTIGYRSEVYAESTAAKGADEVASLLLKILSASHGGCGWLLLACDGEIKNLNFTVIPHFLLIQLNIYEILCMLFLLCHPCSPTRRFFGIRLVPYRMGHSAMHADNVTRKLNDVISWLQWGYIGLKWLLGFLEEDYPGVFHGDT